jgi:hypothetical protein
MSRRRILDLADSQTAVERPDSKRAGELTQEAIVHEIDPKAILDLLSAGLRRELERTDAMIEHAEVESEPDFFELSKSSCQF